MRRRRAAAFGALAVIGVLAAAPPAGAQFRSCPDVPEAQCTRIPVPVDRSGQQPGTISLAVARVRARHPSRRAVLVLQGGPGGAGRSLVSALRDLLDPLLDDRELVGLDPRGTGLSGLLRCPALERETSVDREGPAAGACARALGPARGFYTTEDNVADIEAVRAALGIDTLTIYGVSYGTKIAQLYAARHPDRVDHLVLDSALPLDGPDPFNAPNLRAAPRVLTAVCAFGRCRAVTPDPAGDVREVAARLGRSHIHGRLTDGRGRRRRAVLTGGALVQMLVAGEPFDTGLRVRLPMALRSTRLGDSAPIVRLGVRVAEASAPPRPEDFSAAAFAATLCEEARLPWTSATPPEGRLVAAGANARAVAASVLAPFAPGSAIAGSDTINLCRLWPAPTRSPPPPTGALPDVPVLLLSGELDLRTPLEDAWRIAADFPRATVLRVPGTGHAALAGDPSPCAERAVTAFMRSQPIRRCRRSPGPGVAPLLPQRLSGVTPDAGVAGRRGRVVAAAVLTLEDVLDEVDQTVAAELGGGPHGLTFRGGGLRAGRWRLDADRLVIRGVVVVRGVAVSARIDDRFDLAGTLTIDGPGRLDGRLRVQGRRAAGRLGGRIVRVRLPSAPFGVAARRARAGRAARRRRLTILPRALAVAPPAPTLR